MKKIFFHVFLCAALFAVSAVSDNTPDAAFWYKLEKGKTEFKRGALSTALISFEEAREARSRFFEDKRAALLAFLSRADVRVFQDNLDVIIAFAEKNNFDAALNAFDELFFRVDRGELYGRASAALDFFDALKSYPEAEFWIGEVYGAEGSAAIAVKQYDKALKMAETAGDARFADEIRLKIASLEKLRGAYSEFEKALQKILERDALWSDGGADFVRSAMQKTLKDGGVNQFFAMYRYKNDKTALFLQAHKLLADYYYWSGRHKKAAEHYLFAWTIAGTVIIENFQKKEIAAADFSALSAITGSLSRHPEIAQFMDDADFYKICFYLANSLYGAGDAASARNVWGYLAGERAAGEWKTRAERQLRAPVLDAAVAQP